VAYLSPNKVLALVQLVLSPVMLWLTLKGSNAVFNDDGGATAAGRDAEKLASQEREIKRLRQEVEALKKQLKNERR
jgi:hypothetical protein